MFRHLWLLFLCVVQQDVIALHPFKESDTLNLDSGVTLFDEDLQLANKTIILSSGAEHLFKGTGTLQLKDSSIHLLNRVTLNISISTKLQNVIINMMASDCIFSVSSELDQGVWLLNQTSKVSFRSLASGPQSSHRVNLVKGFPTGSSSIDVDGVSSWASTSSSLRNVRLAIANRLTVPLATSCGDIYGDLQLGAGSALQVDLSACGTAGHWHADVVLPEVVATAAGYFTGMPTSQLRLTGVKASSRVFYARSNGGELGTEVVVQSGAPEAFEVLAMVFQVRNTSISCPTAGCTVQGCPSGFTCGCDWRFEVGPHGDHNHYYCSGYYNQMQPGSLLDSSMANQDLMLTSGTTIVRGVVAMTGRTITIAAGAEHLFTGTGSLALTSGALQLLANAKAWFSIPVAFTDVTANLTGAMCKFHIAAKLTRGKWYLDQTSNLSFAQLGNSPTSHNLNAVQGFPTGSSTIEVDGVSSWATAGNRLRNVRLAIANRLTVPLATSCGDIYGDLQLGAGSVLQVDLSACGTAGHWHADAVLPEVVATAAGYFTGMLTSQLQLTGVKASSRVFYARSNGGELGTEVVVQSATPEAFEVLATVFQVRNATSCPTAGCTVQGCPSGFSCGCDWRYEIGPHGDHNHYYCNGYYSQYLFPVHILNSSTASQDLQLGHGTTVVRQAVAMAGRTITIAAGTERHFAGPGRLALTAGALRLLGNAKASFSVPANFTATTWELRNATCVINSSVAIADGTWSIDAASSIIFMSSSQVVLSNVKGSSLTFGQLHLRGVQSFVSRALLLPSMALHVSTTTTAAPARRLARATSSSTLSSCGDTLGAVVLQPGTTLEVNTACVTAAGAWQAVTAKVSTAVASFTGVSGSTLRLVNVNPASSPFYSDDLLQFDNGFEVVISSASQLQIVVAYLRRSNAQTCPATCTITNCPSSMPCRCSWSASTMQGFCVASYAQGDAAGGSDGSDAALYGLLALLALPVLGGVGYWAVRRRGKREVQLDLEKPLDAAPAGTSVAVEYPSYAPAGVPTPL